MMQKYEATAEDCSGENMLTGILSSEEVSLLAIVSEFLLFSFTNYRHGNSLSGLSWLHFTSLPDIHRS